MKALCSQECEPDFKCEEDFQMYDLYNIAILQELFTLLCEEV